MTRRIEATGYSQITHTFWAQCPHGCGDKATNLATIAAAFNWATAHTCGASVPPPPERPELASEAGLETRTA